MGISIISGVLSGVIFLILLFVIKWNIGIAIVMSVGIYAGMTLLLKPEHIIGNRGIADIKEEMELERKLNEAREDYRLLKASTERIEDKAVQSEAARLNRTSESIIDYLENHPDSLTVAGRFIDYYQDTASSLLKRYVEIQDSRLDTEEVQKLKNNTLKALKTLNQAFDSQLELLMSDEIFDMDAEIRLLEHMAEMENL